MLKWIANKLIARAMKRPPDQYIGGKDDPYLLRWWIVPKNRFLKLYVHCFLRSDDDRALHDHPWPWMSYLAVGSYIEHTKKGSKKYQEGSIRIRSPWHAHRIELTNPVWTIFLMGPNIRQWGFHCPQGWKHWKDFTDPKDNGLVGPGCDN